MSKELAAAGITTLAAANRYIAEVYLPAFNAEFMQPARQGAVRRAGPLRMRIHSQLVFLYNLGLSQITFKAEILLCLQQFALYGARQRPS